jgi:hypothetical protein
VGCSSILDYDLLMVYHRYMSVIAIGVLIGAALIVITYALGIWMTLYIIREIIMRGDKDD